VGVGTGGCVGGGWGGSGVKRRGRRMMVEAVLVYRRMQGLLSMVFAVNGRMQRPHPMMFRAYGFSLGLLRLAIKFAAILFLSKYSTNASQDTIVPKAFSTDIGVHGFIISHGNRRSVRLTRSLAHI